MGVGIVAMTTAEEWLYDVCIYIMGFSRNWDKDGIYEWPGGLIV